MKEFDLEVDSGDRMLARTAANRAVLERVQGSGLEGREGQPLAPMIRVKSGHSDSVGLVPRIDAGFDSGHRFAMLGAIFRPMRQFFLWTFDGDEESEISPEMRSGDSDSPGHE
jgi:hypothetical protein